MKIQQLSIALLVAPVLFVCCNTDKNNDSNQEQEGATASESEGKNDSSGFKKPGHPLRIAYVNIDSVSANYKFMDDMEAKLKEERNKLQSQLESKYSSYDRWTKKMRENIDMMLSSEQKQVQQEMMKRQQEIKKFEQEISMKLRQKEADFTQRNRKKLKKFCESYANEKGFDYVVSYGVGSPILYAGDQYDVTNEVIQQLNADYDSTQVILKGE